MQPGTSRPPSNQQLRKQLYRSSDRDINHGLTDGFCPEHRSALANRHNNSSKHNNSWYNNSAPCNLR